VRNVVGHHHATGDRHTSDATRQPDRFVRTFLFSAGRPRSSRRAGPQRIRQHTARSHNRGRRKHGCSDTSAADPTRRATATVGESDPVERIDDGVRTIPRRGPEPGYEHSQVVVEARRDRAARAGAGPCDDPRTGRGPGPSPCRTRRAAARRTCATATSCRRRSGPGATRSRRPPRAGRDRRAPGTGRGGTPCLAGGWRAASGTLVATGTERG
jgi:hypothetical protein